MIDHLPISIRGKAYRPKKLTMIPKRYIDASEDEVLFIPPIPLLIVEADSPVVFTNAEEPLGLTDEARA